MTKRALQILLGGLGIAAVAIYLSILVQGAAATAATSEQVLAWLTGRPPLAPIPWPVDADNELRFYGALWGAYGVLLLRTASDPVRHRTHVPALMGVFLLGGLGRVVSWLQVGAPSPLFAVLMYVELAYPLLVMPLWWAMRPRPTD